MKIIDLHTHTTASDGIYSPEGLIDFAIENGLSAIAITDHDTVSGIGEAKAYAESKALRLIPGVEFSVEYSSGSFHLLGLNIDHTYSPLVEESERLKSIRDNRAENIFKDLKKHGIEIPDDEIENITGNEAVGRPHIARAIIKLGYADSMDEVFSNYLVRGKPGYVRKERIIMGRAVSLINGAGGVPVIAHPATLNIEDVDELESVIEDFVGRGLKGIEAYSSMHSDKDVEVFIKIAEKYDLLITGGSDFHGDKDETIGNYRPNVRIPSWIIDKFYKRLNI